MELISRQAAIDALERAKQNIRHNIERAIGRAICEILDEVENGIKQLPSANCSEFPNNSDTISRRQAIETFKDCAVNGVGIDGIVDALEQLPLIQPEIIRCKDCKYARLTNDGSCKYCDIWFPDEAEYMDGDYYCASAERKSNG